MRAYRLVTEQRIRKSLEEVFPFFAEAHNLEGITPPWLHFAIETPGSIEMRPGARIDYRLRLHWIPFRWQTEITAWEPPHRFVDTQIRGPYRLWVHEHRFAGDGEETIVRDTVHYAPRGGSLVNRLFVAPHLLRIFRYRQEALNRIFGGTEPARVAIAPAPPGGLLGADGSDCGDSSADPRSGDRSPRE